MAFGLTKLYVSNYRALSELELHLGPINVLFGPNGSGKSTILDAIWFLRDCAIRSVEVASNVRSHGIGLLYDGASQGDPVVVALESEDLRYQLTLGFSAGRIEPMAGENLVSLKDGKTLIHRVSGGSRVEFLSLETEQTANFELREPEKLSLNRFLDFTKSEEAAEFDRILHFVRSYHSRSFDLHGLKHVGSESNYGTTVAPRANNLWSVLRNLEAKRLIDERYENIMKFMEQAFPDRFDALVIEQTGRSSLYAQFLEKERRQPVDASGVSDGHLQLLILLTALFSEGPDRFSLFLIDEPETSLHPWAIAVLAEAMMEAAEKWNKQILVATHSPVLISQFEPDQIVGVEVSEGRSRLNRLSDMPDIQDLLEQYAAGSLFMSEVIAGQSGGQVSQTVPKELEK